MITCTSTVYAPDSEPGDAGRHCGEPATLRVTITGADRGKMQRPGSDSTPWNLERSPRCATCANRDKRIVERFYSPAATFDAEPIT